MDTDITGKLSKRGKRPPYGTKTGQPSAEQPSKGKILCIEDELFITELYERALKKAGYQVTSVIDGDKGLELAKSDQFDIILLDIMVPKLLGIDILNRIRSENPGLKAKIIITTNLEQDDEAREKIESQADGYLIKAEITPKQLVEFLDNLNLNS